jgi:preprotein translocase SecE subunit
MNAIVNYIQGSIEELHHVTWPTQQQAVKLTGITVVFIVVSASFFGIVDGLFSEIVRLTIR